MERYRHEQPGFARRVCATRRVYTDNLCCDVPPLKSIDDPDAAGVFEVDEELDEFLASYALTASRNSPDRMRLRSYSIPVVASSIIKQRLPGSPVTA